MIEISLKTMTNPSFLLPTTVSRSSQSQLHKQHCLLSKTTCHVSYTVTFSLLSREKLLRWEEGKYKVKVDWAWFRVPVVRRMEIRQKEESGHRLGPSPRLKQPRNKKMLALPSPQLQQRKTEVLLCCSTAETKIYGDISASGQRNLSQTTHVTPSKPDSFHSAKRC